MAETAAETHDGPEQEESRRDFLLISTIAVGAAGARELIEADLPKKGYIPSKDAWFVC